MDKAKWSVGMVLIVLLLSLITGCSGDSNSKEAKQSLMKAVNLDPVSLSNDQQAPLTDIKQKVAAFEEIYDVVVVQKDKKIIVAYKVKHLKRFKMKKIEKKVSDTLKDDFNDYNFTVSSDLKIFLETVELIVEVDQNQYPKEKAKKWFGDIVKLNNEMT